MKKILTICICMFLIINISKAQKNLVTNGGFEDDLDAWNNNGAKTTPWDFKSGKNSCAIISPNAENWIGIDQTIQIPKKVQAITFGAWIKAENVVKGKDDWDAAVFIVVFLDSQGKETGAGINIASITGDQEWKLAAKTIKIPENAYSFKIMLAMGHAAGTMLVDDVVAKAATPEEVARL